MYYVYKDQSLSILSSIHLKHKGVKPINYACCRNDNGNSTHSLSLIRMDENI
jgi:hypothetical protein